MTMARLSIRSVLAHKLRLFLTVIAVVLGTAFVSGAMMFTASLNAVFDSAVADSLAGVDAVASSDAGLIKTQQLDELKQDPAVAKTNLYESTDVVVAKGAADPIQTGSSTSTLRPWYPPEDTVGKARAIVSGNNPVGEGEVAIDEGSAEKYGIAVGDQLIVVDPTAQHTYTVSGLISKEDGASHGVGVFMAADAYQSIYSSEWGVKSVLVQGSEAHDADLVGILQANHPEVTFQAASVLSADLTKQIRTALSFVNYFLVAFGLIALLVGTFIIANTFAMLVAQRLKEFALLRALGVSRRQLTASVVVEALIVGVIGSAVGVAAGAGLVQIIQYVMSRMGMPLDNASMGLTAQSVLVPLALGTVVTVLSAWAPARKAGSVRPVEAMRSTESASGSSLVARTIIGAVGILGGIAIIALAVSAQDWSTKKAAIAVGIGAFACIVGFFLASPAFSIPVVGVLGRIIGLPFGAVGKLAATNSRRNPKRTATTAFALTLGVALVSAIGMLSATMRASVDDLVSSEVQADYVLSGPGDGSFPIPVAVPDAVRNTPGVDSMATIAYSQVTIDGQSAVTSPAPQIPSMTYVSTGDLSKEINLTDTEGSFDLNPADVFIADRDFAAANGWQIGQSYPVVGVLGEDLGQATLIGTYGPSKILGKMQLSDATVKETARDASANMVAILVNGTDPNLRANLEQAVADYLVVQVRTAKEYAGAQVDSVTQMLNILYALLALSVIVAVIGIINTLALNVIERRQEIGMLRAVGTQRSQIRSMITIESVQIALYGALTGIVLGLGLGWAFLKVLSSQGLNTIAVPYSQLVLLLIGAGVVGIIAALWPARNAAKTPPLEAIAE